MIYFLQDHGSKLIKIGYAADPWKRLYQIRTATPGHVDLLAIQEGERADEQEIHTRFAGLRSRGEWFTPAPELMSYIASLGKPERECPQSRTRAFWNGMNTVEVSDASGISRGMISMIGSGNRRPSPDVALTIQRATGVSALRLVFGADADEVLHAYLQEIEADAEAATPRQASSEAA